MITSASIDVLVVGAGPGGIAVGAELRRRGHRPVLIERAGVVAPTWETAYERVRLNTVRWLSHLPGRRIPRDAGRWPPRERYLRYVREYARHHGLDIRLGVEAVRIERDADDGWLVETGRGLLRARQVVVATGYSADPVLPRWDGAERFRGPIVHSSGYRDPGPFRGRRVLVVGAGNSGAEIAVDLAEGGAEAVAIAVRTPPHVVRRQVLGLPNQLVAIAIRRLPTRIGDLVAAAGARLAVGDLSRHGLPRPSDGVATRVRRDGAIPIVDAGFVDALRRRDVRVVAPVERLGERQAVLADGSTLEIDAIVAATGYRTGLDRLVGHLGVLDDRGLPIVHGDATARDAAGLRFIGFTNPISGNLRELRLDARRVATAVGRELPARASAPQPARPCCMPQAA